MIDKLISNANRFLMESGFERVKSGKRLDLNNKPYAVPFLIKMNDFFEESEEYEKCHIIKNYIDKILDHESNYR